MTVEPKHRLDEYGLLLTVVSLLSVVVYSGDPYDAWDLILGLLSLWFGAQYLRKRPDIHIYELGLASLICSIGLVAIGYALFQFFKGSVEPTTFICENSKCTKTENADFLDMELVLTMIAAVIIGPTTWKWRKNRY